jgi:hypothetical protein
MTSEMPTLRFSDVIDQFDHVDDPDVLEKAKTNRALSHALEMSRPENWRGSGLSPEQILPLAVESGIPVAWIPPAEVLRDLVAAAPTGRVRVLVARESEVLAQCRSRLEECDDPWVEAERFLVSRALAAYEAGFFEAAMALAVAVGEPLALWASVPRVKAFESEQERAHWEVTKRKNRYGLAKLELGAVKPGEKLKRLEILRYALIGPIPKFFTPFHAVPGEPIPDTVSRHATVHRPTVTHLTKENAVLALMLCVSILRQMQDWAEEVRREEEFYVEG